MGISLTSFAATKTFVSGNWNSAGSWSPSGVPGNNDDVVIPAGKTVTVNCNCGTYSGMRIYVYGTMDFNNGKKINMAADGELHIFSGGKLTGGNGGSKFNIGGTEVYRGSDPDLVGPTFCVTVDACGGDPEALPISLSSFHNVFVEDGVKLIWVTESEINNEYFEVQKRVSDNWETVQRANGAGTSNERTEYTYYEPFESNSSETIYYRLKQVDFDGEFSYSSILTVVIPSESEPTGLTYEIKENVLTFTLSELSEVSISIYSSIGVQITSNQVVRNNESLDLKGLPIGYYFFQFQSKSTTETKKIFLGL